MQTTKSKKNWLITPTAFQRLLEWLDDGLNSDGQAYLEIRGQLVDYLDRKNCLSPDKLANLDDDFAVAELFYLRTLAIQ